MNDAQRLAAIAIERGWITPAPPTKVAITSRRLYEFIRYWSKLEKRHPKKKHGIRYATNEERLAARRASRLAFRERSLAAGLTSHGKPRRRPSPSGTTNLVNGGAA